MPPLSKARNNIRKAPLDAGEPLRLRGRCVLLGAGALAVAMALSAAAWAAQQPTPSGEPVAGQAAQPPAPAGGHTPPVQKLPGGGFQIKHEVALVVLRATVVDKKGRMINDLTQSDFKVFENSVPQKLSVFSHADVPVTMGIVIDDSGSMKEKRPAVNAAALAFVQTSNPQDQVFVVNFNDVAYIDTPGDFASNMEDLRSALQKIDSRGGTALYDAVYTSLDHLRLGNRDKKVLLVITDGVDNESRYSLDELLKYAQESNASIYTIGLLGGEDNSRGLFKISGHGDRRAAKALEEIAHDTGGEVYFPKSLDEVQETCGQIAHDIRNQYTLGYYPTDKAADGTFRAVRVEAFQHGTHRKLIVRTRPGYYAPRSETLAASASSR
jgi:Ca-activated chloride channel homolog